VVTDTATDTATDSPADSPTGTGTGSEPDTATEIGPDTTPETGAEVAAGVETEPPTGTTALAGRPALARPYAWTEGRTRPSIELAIEARVRTTAHGRSMPARRADPLWTVMQLCTRPRSVAEIAALLPVPLGVARVLVADLLGAGLVVVEATLRADAGTDERRRLIERVLSGLRAK
jgi:uncharacterized protein DUF742